jgi:outer membrane autotransporter protein
MCSLTARVIFATGLATALLITPAQAFYSGIERIGIDPRSIDAGTVLRCYQSDALEAGRPYRSYEVETDAALKANTLASFTASAKFAELNTAKDAASAHFNPIITTNADAQETAKAQGAIATALIAAFKVDLKVQQYLLKSAEAALELYKGLKSGRLVGEAALAGAAEGSAGGVLGGPVGVAEGAIEGAVGGTAKAAAMLAFMEASGGLSYYEGRVTAKKAAIAAIEVSIVEQEANLAAAIQTLLNSYAVVWLAVPTPAELLAVTNAQAAYDVANAALLASYDAFAAVAALDAANTPPPCDSLDIAVLLDKLCTSPEQPFVDPADSDMDRAITRAICGVAAEAVDNVKVHTQQAVGSLVGNRMTHVLNNRADLSGFLGGGSRAATGPLGSMLSYVGNSNSMSLAFSGSLATLHAAVVQNQKERALALSFQETYGFPPSDENAWAANTSESTKQAPALGDDASAFPVADDPQDYDVWTQLYGSHAEAGGSKSNLWVGYLGAHYFVAKDTIVGAMLQLDWSSEANSVLGSKSDGLGWMIGPYLATKLPEQELFFDASAAWGRSSNTVTPFATYADAFSTERWTAGAKFTGLITSNGFTIQPSVGASYFEETQHSYIDNNGLVIGQQKFSQGEVRAGAMFSYDFELDGGVIIRPEIGVSAIWSFHAQNGVSAQGAALATGDVRARLDAKIALSSVDGMNWDLSGFYDGIGIDDYSSYGGQVGMTIARP